MPAKHTPMNTFPIQNARPQKNVDAKQTAAIKMAIAMFNAFSIVLNFF